MWSIPGLGRFRLLNALLFIERAHQKFSCSSLVLNKTFSVDLHKSLLAVLLIYADYGHGHLSEFRQYGEENFLSFNSWFMQRLIPLAASLFFVLLCSCDKQRELGCTYNAKELQWAHKLSIMSFPCIMVFHVLILRYLIPTNFHSLGMWCVFLFTIM